MNDQRSLFHDTMPTVDEVMSVWTKDRNFRSRLQIAEALGRSKTPTLISVIQVLVGIGYLTVREIKLPNRIIMYEYSPSAQYLTHDQPF